MFRLRHSPTLTFLAGLIAIIPLLLPLDATSQVDYSIDSMRVVDAEWRVDTLEGFYLKRYHFGEGTLFCSAQHLFVIEIPAHSHRHLAFVHDSVLTTVGDLARRHNAYAAVNGTYFNMDNGNPICYLRINGEKVGENTPQKTDSVNRKYYQYAVMVLNGNQPPSLLVPDSNRLWEELLSQSDIMTAGPMLLHDGIAVSQRDDRTFVTQRHNRTALGLKADGSVLLVVADGRFLRCAEGFSLPELTRVMQWLGCTDAINLDGGGSTTMYVHDKPYDGIVNHPSDNFLHDHRGQRPVSNAILVL